MQKVAPWKKLKRRSLYLPAITIVMVAVTLILMHAISTFRTLDQHRRYWENFFEKTARDILSMVKAEIRDERFENRSSPDGLNGLLDRVVENLDVAYIGLLDESGRWIARSEASQLRPFPFPEKRDWHEGEGEVFYRKIKELPDGTSVFELAAWVPDGDVQAAVVGLWMTPLEKARDQDIRHAFMMGIILLVLGSAAFYFIFVVQNYYLVDRTLAEMKSYTENVVESMANGLITVDTTGRIVSTNRTATHILGMDTVQGLKRSLKNAIHLPGLNLHDVLHRDKPIIEKEIDWPTGRGAIPLSVSVTPLRGPEGVRMGAVIILRDLREIRELQEKVRRSERLASLGRLASGVAHEIRNPLSSIKGFAQYFGDKFEAGSEDKSYAAIMIQEVDRLNRVIAQLLDFARPKDLRLGLYPLSQILEHPLRLIQADLDKTGIKLTKKPFPVDKIKVDQDQITQALLNIFLNATESMEKGGELRVEAVLRPEKRRAEIRISDSGPGIHQEDLSRIFDPFFSTKKKGTGLGLAITAKIIEVHEGELSVESGEGRGTTFKIYLPFPMGGDENGENRDEREDTGG